MSLEDLSDQAIALEAATRVAATAFYTSAARWGKNFPKRLKNNNWAIFKSIAAICMSTGVDIEKFIAAAYDSVAKRHSFVTASDVRKIPLTILAEQPEEKKPDGPSPADLWNMLSVKLLDIVFAAGNSSCGKSAALDNPMYGFPSWFRVFSPEVASQRLIDRWGDLAFEELSSDPTLSAYLKEKRPATYSLLTSVVGNPVEDAEGVDD